MAPHLEKNSIVTDVGSAKLTTINEVSGLFSKFIQFIPAHPIAGTEQSGPYAGFPELFIDRWCILTPLKNNKPSSVNKIKHYGNRWKLKLKSCLLKDMIELWPLLLTYLI